MKLTTIFLENLIKEARVKEVSKTLFSEFSKTIGGRELKNPSTEIGKAYSEYLEARSNLNSTDEADYAKKELLKKIAYSFLQKAYETVDFPLPENLKYDFQLSKDIVFVLSKNSNSDQAIEAYFKIQIIKPDRGPLKVTIDPEESYIKHTDNTDKENPKEYNLWVPSKMAGKIQKYSVGVRTKGEAPKTAITGPRSLYRSGQIDYKQDVKIDLENKDRIQAVKDLDYPWEDVIGQYFPADDSKEPQNENEAKSVAEDVALVAMTVSKTLGALTDLLTDVNKGDTKAKIMSASDKDWYQIEAIFYLDVLKESFPIVRVVVFVNKEDYSVDPSRLKIFITGTQVWP
jgi:hypothetical protein